MNFTTFNNANNYLSAAVPINQQAFLQAAAAFLKAGDHIGHYQAYTRAHAGALQGLATNIWTAQPPGMANANLLAHLAVQVDGLWRNTVKPQGEMQRTAERNQRLAYWTAGNGVGTCPTLEEYAKHGLMQNVLDSLKISKIHLQDYVTLLQALAAPHLTETVINKFNQSHKQAVKLQNEAAAMTGATDAELLESDGSYKKTGEKWARVTACANYWIQELPAAAGRQTARTNIQNWGAQGTADKLMRRVTLGEKDHVTSSHVISQGPASYERHKWFYFRNGAPSVDHPWILTINLRGVGIDFLLGMAQEVSDVSQKTSPHALLRKANEQNCIGIHEELLDIFCATMVNNITSKAA